MWSLGKKTKKWFSVRVLAFLMILVFVVGIIPVSAKSKSTSSKKMQKEFLETLGDENLKKVTYKTESKRKLEIAYNAATVDQELVIDAPNASVVNRSTFKKVTILSAASYAEAANGNVIVVKDENARLIVAKNADVKKIVVSTDSIDITIRSHASVEMLECKKTSAVVNVNVGTKAEADIKLSRKTNLNVTGSKKADIDITSTKKNSTVETSIPVEIATTKTINVIMNEGAEKTEIDALNKNAKIKLENNCSEEPTLKVEGEIVSKPEDKDENAGKNDDKKNDVGSGEETKNDGDGTGTGTGTGTGSGTGTGTGSGTGTNTGNNGTGNNGTGTGTGSGTGTGGNESGSGSNTSGEDNSTGKHIVKTYAELKEALNKVQTGEEIVIDGEVDVPTVTEYTGITIPEDVALSFSTSGKLILPYNIVLNCKGTLVTSADMHEITSKETEGYNAPRVEIINFYLDGKQNHAVWKRGNVTIKVGDYKGNWKYKNSGFSYVFGNVKTGSGEYYFVDHEVTFTGTDDDFNIFKKTCYGEGKYIVNEQEYFAFEGTVQKGNAFTDLRYKLIGSFTDEIITVSEEVVIPKMETLEVSKGVTLQFTGNGKLIFREGASLWIYGTLKTSTGLKELDLLDTSIHTQTLPGIRIMGYKNTDDAGNIDISSGKIISGTTEITLPMDGKDTHDEVYINKQKGLNYQGIPDPILVFGIYGCNVTITDPDNNIDKDKYAWSGYGEAIINGVRYIGYKDVLHDDNDLERLRSKLWQAEKKDEELFSPVIAYEEITIDKEIKVPENDVLRIPAGIKIVFGETGKIVLQKQARLEVYGCLNTSADMKEIEFIDTSSSVDLFSKKISRYDNDKKETVYGINKGYWNRGNVLISASISSEEVSDESVRFSSDGNVRIPPNTMIVEITGSDADFNPLNLLWENGNKFVYEGYTYHVTSIEKNTTKRLASAYVVTSENNPEEGAVPKKVVVPVKMTQEWQNNKFREYDVSSVTCSAVKLEFEVSGSENNKEKLDKLTCKGENDVMILQLTYTYDTTTGKNTKVDVWYMGKSEQFEYN